MNQELEKIHHGILTDEEEEVTLLRLCQLCGHSQEEILEMVSEGIVEARGPYRQRWRFSYRSVERVRKAGRLKKDFDLNLSGVGLVVELLDRIEELEQRLKGWNR